MAPCRLRTAVQRASVAMLLLIVSASSFGATLVVAPQGGDYSSIQAAIDAADAGDEVFVRCGTYYENLTMKDGVHLRGHRAECVIVDAQSYGDVVTIPPVTQPTTVEGLTIRGGEMNAGSNGAGVFVTSGSPTITRNIIEDNGLQGSGVGISLNGAWTGNDNPVISRNVIRNNNSCCYGGGIAVSGTGYARIVNNLIAGNTAYYGGGIYGYIGAVIENNTFLDNDAWIGGAVASFGGSLILVNNLFDGNAAYIYGGGVYTNDISVIENNNAIDNTPDNWATPVGDMTGTNRNISVPSRLMDRDLWTFDGVQPRTTSGLLEAGTLVPAPAFDLRGIARPLDADADGNPKMDIGARENEGVTGVLFEPNDVLTWDTSGQLFNFYRGDLATLRATGEYTQDPALVPGAAVQCGFVQPPWHAAVDPAAGDVYFYLIQVAGFFEAPLGFASDGTPRPQTLINCLD